MSDVSVVFPAPDGPTNATVVPGAPENDTPRRIQSDGSVDSAADASASSDGTDTSAAAGYRNHTSDTSTCPAGWARGTASGASTISDSRSSTSNTRSKDTSAVSRSTRVDARSV